MLLPEFTIKNLLTLTLVCGVFFAVLGSAVRGADWAVGITMPIVVVLGGLVLQMGTYLLAYTLGSIAAPSQGKDVASPFAEDKPSEQVIAPQEKEW